jgi:hypothetical protein
MLPRQLETSGNSPLARGTLPEKRSQAKHFSPALHPAQYIWQGPDKRVVLVWLPIRHRQRAV